jgi:two-component system, cell cycle sensor histidine kinase and response regulator CckA
VDASVERLFEMSLDMLCVIGTDGALRRVNPAFTETLGWRADELVSHMILDFVHPADLSRARAALAHAEHRDRNTPDEYRCRCADGSYRWLAWRSSAPDADCLVYATARDVTHRKRVEAELQALHDYAAVGIAMSDHDGKFLKVNPALCEMLGYSESELLEMTSVDITFAEDRAAQSSYMSRLIAGDLRSCVVEKRYVRKDGTAIWGRVTLSAIIDETATNKALMAVVEDVTQSRATGIALLESEARYFRIASNVPGMMYQFRKDANGSMSFPFISNGAMDIYGVPPSEIQANPQLLTDFVHPDDRDGFTATRRLAAETRAPWRWAGRITVNGVVKWVEGSSRPQSLSDGVTVWDGLFVDVTEAREAAARLQESEHRYRSLFDNHPDAVFSLDLSGNFASSNPECTKLSGYAPGEMLGRGFDTLLPAKELSTAFAHFQKAREGTASTFNLTLHHKDGHPVELSVTNIPVVVAGAVSEVFGIARDLTAQRELESQLRHAQKMEAVGQLAAGVAHDFNNVLTVIQGCSEFLRTSLSPDDERREDVDMIRDAASRAATLTRQLLAFSRKQVLQPAIVDLNGCIENLSSILGRMVGEDIDLIVDLADDLGFICADAGQLEQVIVNMAVNARDAMQNGGELRLVTRNCTIDAERARHLVEAVPGPYVCLSISDNGCGMDAATCSRVFEPFFTTKGAGKGTGLGLAMAYGIIRQSSGYVAVASTPGSGTTFDIYLPAVDASAHKSARSSS